MHCERPPIPSLGVGIEKLDIPQRDVCPPVELLVEARCETDESLPLGFETFARMESGAGESGVSVVVGPNCDGCSLVGQVHALKCDAGYWKAMHARAVERCHLDTVDTGLFR